MRVAFLVIEIMKNKIEVTTEREGDWFFGKTNNEKKYEIEKNKLNEIVEKMVKNELAKRTKEIVNLEITIDNRKEKISGYWEDKYTKFVVIK